MHWSTKANAWCRELRFSGRDDVLESNIDTHPLEQVYEHFSIAVEGVYSFCDARRVRSTETIPQRGFPR
jgi:hypothetical protein